jgi:hypothetical protein
MRPTPAIGLAPTSVSYATGDVKLSTQQPTTAAMDDDDSLDSLAGGLTFCIAWKPTRRFEPGRIVMKGRKNDDFRGNTSVLMETVRIVLVVTSYRRSC